MDETTFELLQNYAKEILDGIFALITPVITFTEGLCVAITRCIPAALAI